jgi:small subunit ribosomal protein S27e
MPANFVRVACADCEAEQIVFENASTVVECADCGAELVRPAGGKAAIAGEVTETVEAR